MKKASILAVTILIFFRFVTVLAQEDKPDIQVTQINGNLYKFNIGSVNLIALVGEEGVLLSDDAFEDTADLIKKELRKIGYENIKYVINTHWHSDHVGGNLVFGRDAVIIAQDNVRKLLSRKVVLPFWEEEHEALPEYARPDITFSKSLTLYYNGEVIKITHLSNGHTDGDAVVYFKNANVLHMGDLLFSDSFPAVDFENGGDVAKFAENLQWVIDNIPADVKIIAGHGPDYTVEQLKVYKNMLLSTLKIVRNEMKKGSSPEDMKKRKILKDWEKWANDFFTCELWIDIIYNSLVKQ
ncbi:MBL fold metallo-hydrolase [candidate division KSB1 bacterium]